jgi:hypothetical protein
VTPSLTLSSSKAIFLAGTIIAYLSLAISFTGNDLHGLSGLNFRLALAAMFLCVQVAFLSMANTVLFALLAFGVGISKRIPRVLYYPEISLLFCMILLGAANWCWGLSIFLFFKDVDCLTIFPGMGMLVFMGLGYGPVLVLILVLYLSIRPIFSHWYFSFT